MGGLGDLKWYKPSIVYHGWAVKKNVIPRTSKTPILSFWEYIIFRKINLGRKS